MGARSRVAELNVHSASISLIHLLPFMTAIKVTVKLLSCHLKITKIILLQSKLNLFIINYSSKLNEINHFNSITTDWTFFGMIVIEFQQLIKEKKSTI